jgi:hypothetical protein
MESYTPNPDLLESGGPVLDFDGFGQTGSPAFWHEQSDMSVIDPELQSLLPYECFADTQLVSCFDGRHTTYDPNAHGFSPPQSTMFRPSVLPQLGMIEPDFQRISRYRHLRQFSPSDPRDISMASTTDSSTSDYASSPDMAFSPQEHLFAFGHHATYDSFVPPLDDHTSWSPQASLELPTPLAPLAPHQIVPSMRDLQVTPDPEQEEGSVDVVDILHAKFHAPEEIDISEQVATPPASDDGHDDLDDVVEYVDEHDKTPTTTGQELDYAPSSVATTRESGKRHSSPGTRRPRAVLDPQARITKPAQRPNQASSTNARSKPKNKPPVRKGKDVETKCFPCVFHHFGCGATFANKNEWKRHVSSQHLQLGFFRCDMGSCADITKGYNDFNRKDLFTQHCRRMHAPWSATKKGEKDASKKEREAFDNELERIRARCWMHKRNAPQKTKCGFCAKKFVEGNDSKGWDERMEHMGKHYERDGKRSEDEDLDEGLQTWAIDEGVIQEGRRKGEYWLPGFEPVGASKVGAGQRRSRRLVKDDESDNDMDVEACDDAVEDVGCESVPVIQTSKRPISTTVEVEDDDDSDTDAEAEDE